MVPTFKHALSLSSLAIHIWCSVNLTLSHEFDNDLICKTTATAPMFDKTSIHWTPNSTLDSVQLSLSHVPLFANPWTTTFQASLPITNSWSLPKLRSIVLVMPTNHLILYLPFLLPPSIFPSIRVFPKESVLHIRWPKYWSFSFSIGPSNE